MSLVLTNIYGRIVHENRGGVERFYVPDPLGNTAALVDATGAVKDSWTYWPYGEVQNHAGSSTTAFTFLGTLGYFTDAIGRLYVRARYLESALTRWLTVDPLWPSQPAYTYVSSRPLRLIDPSGRLKIPFPVIFYPWNPADPYPLGYECGKQGIHFTLYPVYGNFCGPQTIDGTSLGSGNPVDQVDACCRNHDGCFAQWGCTGFNQFSNQHCADCSIALCNCLKRSTCGKFDLLCILNRQIFELYACSFTNAPTGPGGPMPPVISGPPYGPNSSPAGTIIRGGANPIIE